MPAALAHPLADATAPCGGPASCGCCAVELWREEAARGREIDAGSIAQGQMARDSAAFNLNETATMGKF